MACGREANEMKGDKINCLQCGAEFVAKRSDSRLCSKQCNYKYFGEHKGEKHKTAARNSRPQKQAQPASRKGGPTTTRATPEQIIADLRRGFAIEIIEMIQEKFGL
jgi:hypothetical protein